MKEFVEFAKEAVKINPEFSMSVEINPHLEKAEDMIEEAKKIYNLCPEVFAIKIPCNEQGLIAAKKLVEEGVTVNVTLVFSQSQALQVGRIGAAFCSPFIGWPESSGVNTDKFIKFSIESINSLLILFKCISISVWKQRLLLPP